jgi:hypothetical protein
MVPARSDGEAGRCGVFDVHFRTGASPGGRVGQRREWRDFKPLIG